MTDTRLPAGYDVPQAVGNYVKLGQGTTKLRILSQPIIGWLDWMEEDGKKKPLRFPMDKKPSSVHDPKGLKHFRAMVVWNYTTEKIQIREITQKSLMNQITALVSDEDFKDVYSYDLKVNKEGEKMETKYNLLPGKIEAVDTKIQTLYFNSQVKLDALFEGLDPFQK